jgi:hypothetical protein
MAASLPARNSASITTIRSNRLRSAAATAPASPFFPTSAAIAARISPSEMVRWSVGEGAAVVIMGN